jgi:hypothetical protein
MRPWIDNQIGRGESRIKCAYATCEYVLNDGEVQRFASPKEWSVFQKQQRAARRAQYSDL